MKPAALLLVAALLLPGCVLDPRSLEAPDPEPTVLPWGLSGCSFVIAVVPVPAAALAARLPSGFRVLTPAEAGLPSDPRGDGNLGVEAWRCNQGVGHNASVELNDVSYGAVFTFVEPPPELRDNESRYHFVKWDVLVPDAERRVLLAERGVPAQNGTVEFRRFQEAAGRIALDAGLDLNGTYAFQGVAGAPAGDSSAFSFTEFTPTPHGLVRWRTNVTAGTLVAGGGVLATPPGFVREVVGAERVQAYLLAGSGGAFENGTIVLPPAPQA